MDIYTWGIWFSSEGVRTCYLAQDSTSHLSSQTFGKMMMMTMIMMMVMTIMMYDDHDHDHD